LFKRVRDFYSIIASNGHTEDEFEIFEKEDPFPRQGIGPITGRVTVRNTKTGVERTYRAGHGTAWIVDFEKDLRSGLFMV
jgi:hypothetical protein